MPDNHDPLSQLWLEQQVEKPDFKAISKKWRNIKFKQRFYVFLDVMSVLFTFGVWAYIADKLDGYSNLYFAGVCFLSLIFVIYVIWLRRFSLGWSDAASDQHIQILKKQITNNIKIALLSKHSVWVALLLIAGHNLALFYFEVFPAEKLLRKSMISFALLGVMCPALWIWASKRQKRFTKELLELNNLLSGSNSKHHE